jgi:MFS family permease
MTRAAPRRDGALWYRRGWLLLGFAAVVLAMSILTLTVEHEWHGQLLVWAVVVCAVGAVSTTVGTRAVTGLPGVDEDVRRGQRRDAVVRAGMWLAAGLIAGWIAALLGWGWIVVVLAVYVVLNAMGFAAMYYVRRLRSEPAEAGSDV